MFFLAIRHLFTRKRQTLLTLLGILLGSAAYVIISGMMLGFREFLIDQLINNDAHIRVSAQEKYSDPKEIESALYYEDTNPSQHVREKIHWITVPYGNRINRKITYPAGWFERCDSDPRVTAYSPQLSLQAVINRAGISRSTKVVGVIPSKQIQVTNIAKYMKTGTFTEIEGGNRIILGGELFKKLGARLNEIITLSIGNTGALPFKIVGTFDIGVKMLDESTAFMSLADAQKLQKTPGEINEIAIRISDVTEAKQIATNWATTSPDKVQSWDQINANFFSIFKMQDTIRYLMTLAILTVAGFGIYNILNMIVTQKRRDIAILRSMGFLASDILFLFFIQGLILGLLGGSLGILVGYWICQYIETITLGGTPVGSMTHMLVSYNPKIYTFGFAMAAISAAVASLLPARTAGRLSPIEIIRAGE